MFQSKVIHWVAASLWLATSATSALADVLDDGFHSPPPEARSRVIWQWVNGNISREGITADLEAMQRAGWRVEYGAPGSGSFADRSAKLVTIDGNDRSSDAAVLQTLAHESGHATYTQDPYVSYEGVSRQEFVDRNVMRSLKDEGEATMTNIDVRNELRAAGGPDIGVAGAQSSDYERVAGQYPNAADRDRAREEIGRLFSSGEHPSTSPNETYGAYYGHTYESFYDQNATPPH